MGFTHFDENGKAVMVDVTGKDDTAREAQATGKITVSRDVFRAVSAGTVGKGDVLGVNAPFMVAVALKDTDDMVGEIVVMPKDGTISMGYTFHYAHHRRGYAFEALSALINLLHETYPEWDFICFTEPENEPSKALLMKLGYKDMGYIPSMESRAFGKWTSPDTDAEIAQAIG